MKFIVKDGEYIMEHGFNMVTNEWIYMKTTPKNDTNKTKYIMAGGVQADDEPVIKRQTP